MPGTAISGATNQNMAEVALPRNGAAALPEVFQFLS